MKTSKKFAIAFVAMFAANAHAQLSYFPEATQMEEAQVCRMVTSDAETLATDYAAKNAYFRAATVWQKQWTKLRQHGMVENRALGAKLDQIRASNGGKSMLVQAHGADCMRGL